MISVIPKKSFEKELASFSHTPSEPLVFKIRCATASYNDDENVALYKRYETGSLIFSFFSQIILLAENDDLEEIGGLLSVLKPSSIEAQRETGQRLLRFLDDSYSFKNTCYSFKKCEKREDEPPFIKNEKISVVAKGICESFGVDGFDQVYTDLCRRVNKGYMDTYLRPDLISGCAMHKYKGERLISGFFVDRDKREKGLGTAFMTRITDSVNGKVGVIHREELTSFYAFMGFTKSEELISINRG